MPAVQRVRLPLGTGEDSWLDIAIIPRDRGVVPAPLIDRRNDPEREEDLEAIQLLEGVEYRFAFHTTDASSRIETDRPELFEADDAMGRTGRLRPGLSVGLIPVAVSQNRTPLGHLRFEVRSRKLSYQQEYRWMLRDVAETVAEVVMERFATAEHSFRTDPSRDSQTAYQRFAFLKALFDDEQFQAALRQITQRPFVAWEDQTEVRDLRRGAPSGSRLAREIAKANGSRRYPSSSGLSLPQHVAVRRPIESLDNVPNRFVAFALRRWDTEAAHVERALASIGGESPQRARGLREVSALRVRISAVLNDSALREVGLLSHLPTNNTVLLRRPGYRDIYRAFLEFEMAAQLGWTGGDFVFGAGQKNVAVLYEYWCYLQLASILASVAGSAFSLSDIIKEDSESLSVSLSRGTATQLSGSVVRNSRRIDFELWFNRTFSGGGQASWSLPMRPDCSLRLTPENSFAEDAASVWLHFDAKYRIESLQQMFSAEPEPATVNAGTRSRRDDLLKMHAYRDAIRRSAGAYVLYPGDSTESIREFHEVLPGLGAFALRPTESGAANGATALALFLDDVLDHVSRQTSQHERNRYWSRRVFDSPAPPAGSAIVPFLSRPPADTPVLLCFAKSAEHVSWIRSSRIYNIRGDRRRGALGLDSPALASEFALVYCLRSGETELFRISGAPTVVTASHLSSLGYPDPRGEVYLCLPLTQMQAPETLFSANGVAEVARQFAGARPISSPIGVTWQDVLP